MVMKSINLCLAASLTLALAACGDDRSQQQAEAPAPAPAEAPAAMPTQPDAHHSMHGMGEHDMAGMTMAEAVLSPTQGHEASGTLLFVLEDGGIRLTGSVTGLEPGGVHGFHIHETGDCSAPDAMSAGGHFNPEDHAHGRRSQGEFHAGDMDNLEVGANGLAEVDMLLGGLELGTGGPLDIDGKAVVVHVQPDDYESQPTGDAGARVACGVIEMHDH
jgi:superoxide dismutase, Cu-Zn family